MVEIVPVFFGIMIEANIGILGFEVIAVTFILAENEKG